MARRFGPIAGSPLLKATLASGEFTCNAVDESWAIDCDWLATSAGLSPNTELAQLLGCAITDDAVQVNESQATTVRWSVGGR